MFNTKAIENLFDSTFKPDDFYKNLANMQISFTENYQNFSKTIEDNTKKSKYYFDEQSKLFNLNNATEKLKEVRKANEQNFNKIKSYMEKTQESFNNESVMTEIKKISETAEENNLKAFNFFKKNTELLNSNTIGEQAEKVNKIIQESQKKTVNYFSEQYEFWKNFNEELLASMKTEDGFKNITESIKNYSKQVTNSNLKKIDESLEVVKKTISK